MTEPTKAEIELCPFCGVDTVIEYVDAVNTLWFMCRCCEVKWTRLGDKAMTFKYLNARTSPAKPACEHEFASGDGCKPFCLKCGIYQAIHPDFGNTECKPSAGWPSVEDIEHILINVESEVGDGKPSRYEYAYAIHAAFTKALTERGIKNEHFSS